MALSDTAIVQAVATLQAFPGLSGVSDTNAERLIERASDAIRKYTGRQYLIDDQSDKTMYLDGEGLSELVLPDGPVTALTSVSEDSNRTFASSSNLDLDDIMIYGGYRGTSYDDDYKDFPSRLALYNTLEGFSTGKQNIKIVGRFGYNDENTYYPIPDDLIQACLLMCKYYYLNSDVALKAERTQTYSYERGGRTELRGGLPVEIADMLEMYRRFEVY